MAPKYDIRTRIRMVWWWLALTVARLFSRDRGWIGWWFVALALALLLFVWTSVRAQQPPTPTVQLETQNSQGRYAGFVSTALNEGAPLRFRAVSDASANVTVTVRVEADAAAVAMGYASNAAGETLAFSGGLETPAHARTAAGNTTDEANGIITLTLLPGAGYEVGSLAVVTVTIVDDDGNPHMFRDCSNNDCPEMVTIPGGTFLMGSLESDDPDSVDLERPQHAVTISPFAAGRYEVTFAEWDACVSDGGCTHSPSDLDWGRGAMPVINVTWEHAQEYVAWLSRETGETYRLLTEAEWEYAARAGATTTRPWGNDIGSGNAICQNCQPEGDPVHMQTAEVGTLDPNAFGLYDMLGNVLEWTEDCWHPHYNGAPTDGSAWGEENDGNCELHVARGGWHFAEPAQVRSAIRQAVSATDQDEVGLGLGFRVARVFEALPPTVRLEAQNAGGNYVAVKGLAITEGDTLRFRAGSDESTDVTVTVRVDADAIARAMGYVSNVAGEELTFSGLETPAHSLTATNNSNDESVGTITLTLLPGAGYQVGPLSVITVTVLDDDGDPHRFRDCADCPEMVTVPAGTFTMGSPDDEKFRDLFDEKPQHTVTIAEPFAVGRYEVTFDEWDACHAAYDATDGAEGCSHDPGHSGWGRGTRPVINVNWSDAQEYVRWLSQETGWTYRLLSESEWEYAARAGTTTAYPWGGEIGSGNANCGGCGGDWNLADRTAPVGTFAPNAFGLHDMHGNVIEWTEDCWHNNYTDAPDDGTAWGEENSGDCGRHPTRGGSWDHSFGNMRSAERSLLIADRRVDYAGFRVARTFDIRPTVHLQTLDAEGRYAEAGDLIITEGDAFRFRAATAEQDASVTVTVRVQANAAAVAMGYASNHAGEELAFSDSRKTPHLERTSTGNSAADPLGTVTLTLLPGPGYEVGAPSVFTVTIVDDDGGDPLVFRDCDDCPEMVTVPAGTFTMGSPDGEGEANERPQHTVTISPFAVGRFEVTFDEWAECRTAGDCTKDPGDGGWGKDRRPVIHVSWNDAQEYVTWLSQKTGETYRLLSEAEWEYAARGGATTEFPWGSSAGTGNANCRGCGAEGDANPGNRTAPVGSYPPNDFGLYDMGGNVQEWVEDCYHDSYTGAPIDGGVWEGSANCQRVIRDGSWNNVGTSSRSAKRSQFLQSTSLNTLGFRVARTGAYPSSVEAIIKPTIHLVTQNSQGSHIAASDLTLNEGATLSFRAISDRSTNVTVKVRIDADTIAEGMGYTSNADGAPLVFSGAAETPPTEQTAGGDTEDSLPGTVILTLLPGDNYEVGEPSVVTVAILDDEGDQLTFRDCEDCPEVVTVPGGTFGMGLPDSSPLGFSEERPQHTVTVSPFAIGRFEVTFAEWDACHAAHTDSSGAEGCSHNPGDGGWTPRGNRPVINVSWDDAQEYVAWLTQKTGVTWRLPTEAEWEYAARAGTTTRYPWGDNGQNDDGNCNNCSSSPLNRTAPVGSWDGNAFGLHDMHGNVREWVEDCWHDNYDNAPTDGGEWEGAANCRRVVRDGSWNLTAQNMRSSSRWRESTTHRSNDLGFRVARASVVPLATATILVPTVEIQRISGPILTEGETFEFKATSDRNTSVTVKVGVEADAAATAMGYASNAAGEPVAFTRSEETPPQTRTAGGDSAGTLHGTLTLTLLEGSGYEVGSSSVLTVTVLDDDGATQAFRDGAGYPQMVTVPGGTFRMGSPNDEAERDANEGPQRTVTIAPFAAGRYEVTFDEYDACRADNGCTGSPQDEMWGRGSQPVINVRRSQAQQYVAWLTRKTGTEYRLLTEAEWEYAARAGSTTRYPWGDDALKSGNANCRDCGGAFDFDDNAMRRAAPVGRYDPNDFGLHDMAGNVREWVEDCWHDGYTNAPTDGRAWAEATCTQYVVRGGSWDQFTDGVRSAARASERGTKRHETIGFRVARTAPLPLPTSTLVGPTVHLQVRNAHGDYVRGGGITLNEGGALRFKAVSNPGSAVTATVRVEADATAVAMGYATAGTDNVEAVLSGVETPEVARTLSSTNGADDAAGTVTLTLLDGDGYEVGAPSVLTVNILDADAGLLKFRDCDDCPDMVALPAGTFTMGIPESDEDYWLLTSSPQRTVSISAFAVGRFEVTFDEWKACVDDGGCLRDGTGYTPADEGWGRGDRPVIHVSWDDAQRYVAWLTQETGATYRLLTEAEWEYAARAGTQTRWHWGDTAAGSGNANCDTCGGDWDARDQTAPVGSFSENAFGLHDMSGNVFEWVQDCWHENYAKAPIDGRAWGEEDDGDCTRRVSRGGSWSTFPTVLGYRAADAPGTSSRTAGFRVARASPVPLATATRILPVVRLLTQNHAEEFVAESSLFITEGATFRYKVGADQNTSVTATVRVEADAIAADSMGYVTETSEFTFSTNRETGHEWQTVGNNSTVEPPGTLRLTLLPGDGYEVGEPASALVTVLDDDGGALVFRDCDECPQMVALPAGTFTMGSPEDEGITAERPQHTVTIDAPFAVGRHEVTFAEWGACVTAGQCTNNLELTWASRERHPVNQISWDGAQEYVTWLSEKAGTAYRLLTEAEWEYAARAGSTTAYPWGATAAGTGNAHCSDCQATGSAPTGAAPVGSYAANDFGLYDTVGNVYEWVEDCWHPDYENAPTDGNAWLGANSENCNRVVRGGSYNTASTAARSASRADVSQGATGNTIGFRVARTSPALLAASTAVKPTVHLETWPGYDMSFIAESGILLTEGDHILFKAVSDQTAFVTVTVTVEADEAALAMGYGATTTQELVFDGDTETLTVEDPWVENSDTNGSYGTVTLRIAESEDYEVGEPSVVLVTLRERDSDSQEHLTFRDHCRHCPEVVSVPAGTFTMGTPGSLGSEQPQHTVTVAPFAIGKYEVTFAEWDACVSGGGCTTNPGDETWGRGKRPVINVSWEDAQAYVTWLSREAGATYRLISEAEWEYAARAGATTTRPWGDDIGTGHANCDGCQATGEAAPTETEPVGSFPPNAFGLYDMLGNVSEWVEDCWHDNYTDAPTDGSAWGMENSGVCDVKIGRGGAWSTLSEHVRSAFRSSNPVGQFPSSNATGFRVARSNAAPPPPPPILADPDVNNDDAVNASDALILYYAYALRSEIGSGR